MAHEKRVQEKYEDVGNKQAYLYEPPYAHVVLGKGRGKKVLFVALGPTENTIKERDSNSSAHGQLWHPFKLNGKFVQSFKLVRSLATIEVKFGVNGSIILINFHTGKKLV